MTKVWTPLSAALPGKRTWFHLGYKLISLRIIPMSDHSVMMVAGLRKVQYDLTYLFTCGSELSRATFMPSLITHMVV